MLQPLGHRVLIRPDDQPEEAGAILLPQDREYVPTVGTIVALGDGSKRDAAARKRAVAHCIEIVGQVTNEREDSSEIAAEMMIERLRRYAARSDRSPDAVKVGDRVAFPDEVGSAVTVDGTRYLILPEDDLLIIEHEEVPV
jgi:co-chaperonin GroES (HSP10)